MQDTEAWVDKLYWEDFVVGVERRFGCHAVTADEMIAFGQAFDPQLFHVDATAAAQGPFGGLVASGWQTAGFCMRMMVDHVLNQSASLGSPGLEKLRWKKPVRPGDTLTVRTVVLDRRVSRSRPQMGLVRTRLEARNQHGEVVFEMISQGMFARRPGALEGEVTA